MPLLTWVALFHFADATQAVTAFVLRAYRIVTVPLVVNTVALWGVGIGGGYLLAFDRSGRVPAALLAAPALAARRWPSSAPLSRCWRCTSHV